MAYSRRQGEFNDDDLVGRSNGDDFEESSSVSSGAETSTAGSGLAERLTNILVEQGDGDLLLQRSDREDMVFQWLQALDMQVMGACRADERLKPLLKLNTSSSGAEDRLWAHLSQHFEPSEVGVLAMCFCIPLVSIRVGKINKQGTLLCPTATRGNLNLTLLPASDLRLSFIGDDGHAERLFTLNGKEQSHAVALDEIPTDSSGRSFLIKIPDGTAFYFWCSEKSTLFGSELLAKMKDLLRRKPSIAELTGISKSRLDCFATQLRGYLVGSNLRESSDCSAASSSDGAPDSDAIFLSAKSLCSRHGSQTAKTSSPYQGSLSPKSSSFKEGLPKSLSSLRNAAREKLRRRGDNHLSAVDNLLVTLPHSSDVPSSNQCINEKQHDVKKSPSSFLESLGNLKISPTSCPVSHVSSINPPLFSPYYCWCPQGVSSFQYPTASSQMPTSLTESPLLPPLSSLLSVGRSSAALFPPTPPLSLADIPSMDFPALLPDPLFRLPMPSSQQIPTFTPLMCDPIVHIPVIDVCSSGQGYLVSAGPSISSSMPPLHPNFLSPLIPETDSLVEKGARETLRLLLSGSSQPNPQLFNVFPAVLSNTDEKHAVFATVSRSFYTGTADIDTLTDIMTASAVSSKGINGIASFIATRKDLAPNINILEDGSCSDDEGSVSASANTREGTTS